MKQTFIKAGVERSYTIVNGKVKGMIKIGDNWVANASIEDLLADGWHEVETIGQEPELPSVEELVEQRLRLRYSINQEFEVQRKRETEPDEFNAYYDYVEECIAWAHQQPNRDDVNNTECVARE